MATRKDSRRTGLWPLAYMGVEPVAPPLLLTDNRAPTANDYKNFNVGTWWINRATAPAEELWILVNKDNNVARWIQFITGATGIQTLTGDFGGAVGPDGALDIDIIGSGPYLFTGNPGLHLLQLSDDGTVATQYDADVGFAIPALNILEILGGAHINTAGAGNTITVNLDNDIADTYTTDAGNAIPVAGVLNIFGGTHASTTGAGNTVTVNVDDDDLADSFPTDAGTATPAAGVLNVLGGLNINTAGAGNTVTVNMDDPGQGVVQSDGAGVLSASTGTDGQILIDATATGNAVWANITSAGGTITVTNGPNTINLETAGTAGGTKVTKFTSSGTWTKDTNAQFIEVYVWDGGSGGGSGRRGVSTQSGGGGGGSPGSTYMFRAPAFLFGATEGVIIGAAAAGGVTQSVNNTNGNAGAAFNATAFGFIDSDPAFGAIAGGAGGVNGTAAYGTQPHMWDTIRNSPTLNGHRGGFGEVVAGGDAQILGTSTAYLWYVGSGGGGGGAGADAVAERAGGAGSELTYSSGATLVAAAAGGTESGTINGAAGANNTAFTSGGALVGGLGGGGGGGQHVGGAAGDGGAGGTPGGAGGGGGGSLNGTNSGVGGAGGRGEVIIIEYTG